jgi:hypothetical protein
MIAAFVCAFAAVKPTNFSGFDEWLWLWLATRGILAAPYANRPLNFLWTIPGAWFGRGFLGFHVMHMVYLAATGLLTRALARRLAPGREGLATLAGLAAAIFVPADMARLSTVQMTVVSGATFGASLSLVALVEASHRRRPLLVAVAATLAFVTVRSYEAPLLVLVAGPLLLYRPGGPSKPPFSLVVVWEVALVAAAILVAVPYLFPSGRPLYQTSVWDVDLRPARVLQALLHQYVWHLGPLVQPAPAALGSATAIGAAGLAVLAMALSLGRAQDPAVTSSPHSDARTLAWVALVGVGFSFAAYFPFCLSPLMDAPHRAQMAAAPWIALLLGAVVEALGRLAPRRAGGPLRVLLAGWIVLVGAGRTASLQQVWNGQSLYAAQMRSLSGLARLAPRLAPHTLVLAVQEGQVWPSVFGFRHAIAQLYRDTATGYVVGGLELMYPTRKTAEGVVTNTWPELQAAWGLKATSHRYDEMVVVRIASDGTLSVLTTWPDSVLGALPAGAVYVPGERIRTSS